MNELFYLVMRCFIKQGTESHSVEKKDNYPDAQKRFYSILDADVNNDQIEYISAYVLDSNGAMMDWKVIDRRTTEQEGA